MTLEKPSREFYREFEPTKEDILILKEWIAKMPHILQDYDDYFLAALIRSRKGSIQKTKILLEHFNSLCYRYPKVLGHLDPLNDITQKFLNAMYASPLPKRAEDGSLICLLVGRHDPDLEFNWYGGHCMWLMYLLIVYWEKMEGNTKAIIVGDFSNASLARLKTMTPTLVRDTLWLLTNSPCRLQAIHLINVPPFWTPILNFAMSFAKNKIIKRLQFHSTLETLFEKVPRQNFPKEYGGDEASIVVLNDAWRKKLASYRADLIKTGEKMKKLDPLRPKLDEYDQELEGTFRQLHFD